MPYSKLIRSFMGTPEARLQQVQQMLIMVQEESETMIRNLERKIAELEAKVKEANNG